MRQLIFSAPPLGAALLLLAAALTGGCEDPPCGALPCAEGEACVAERCVPSDGSCRDASDCTAVDAPICPAPGASCRPCETHLECGALQRCDPSGRCEPAFGGRCSRDADCGEATWPVCDGVRGRCAQCASDGDCDGVGATCDPGLGRCEVPTTCAADTDCDDLNRPYCDPARRQCVACLDEAHCPEGWACGGGACEEVAPCEADQDCALGARCDLGSGACVECVEDGHCVVGTGRTCDRATQTCTPGEPCLSDPDCTSLSTPRCDTRAGLCVVCMASADCAGAGSTCELESRSCRPAQRCVEAADCDDPTLSICSPEGLCVECLAAADCAAAGARCEGGVCSALAPREGLPGAPCRSWADCAASSTLPADQYRYLCLQPGDAVLPWQWYQGYCLGVCEDATQCPEGSVCLGGGCFDRCEGNGDCRAGYTCQELDGADGTLALVCAPACDPALAAQISCVADYQCGTGRCDLEAGTCACSPIGGPCAGQGFCGAGASCVPETDGLGRETGFPGGYCLELGCDPPSKPCPAGSSCYALDATNTACLPDCDPNLPTSCERVEYGCAELPSLILGGGCAADADCPAGTPRCYGATDAAPGTCIRACAADSDCDTSQGHYCMRLGGVVALCADPHQLGTCLAGCLDDLDCGACASDLDCGAAESCDRGRCRRTCSAQRPCPEGLRCGGVGLCGAPCAADLDCGRGGTCEEGTCLEAARRCDPVARRCDPACADDLDCGRVRTCDTATERCQSPCDPELEGACGPAGSCDPALPGGPLCKLDCRAVSEACAPETYCSQSSGDCLERCPPFGAGSCGPGEVCEPLDGSCVPHCGAPDEVCATTNDCAPGQICFQGQCETACRDSSTCGPAERCIGSACTTCTYPRWRCDAADSGLCVGCFDDGDCPSSHYCDQLGSRACVERCGGVSGGNRSCPLGEVCDLSGGGQCQLPCATDLDCGDPARPACDTGLGLCIPCADDRHCPDPAAPACDPTSQACVPCVADAHCSDPSLPACDTATLSCVPCTTSAHCADPSRPVCETGAQACVECVGDGDCPLARPRCALATNSCEGCQGDTDCGPGLRCHLAVGGGECHPACGELPGQILALATLVGAGSELQDSGGAPAPVSAYRQADDLYAQTAAGAPLGSALLQGFPFSLPAGATLVGVQIEVEAGLSGPPGGEAWTLEAALRRPTGEEGAPRPVATLSSAQDATFSPGGAADLWGLALSAAELAHPAFGVRLSLSEASGAPLVAARLDLVRLIAHYTTPGPVDCAALGAGLSCGPENLCQ